MCANKSGEYKTPTYIAIAIFLVIAVLGTLCFDGLLLWAERLSGAISIIDDLVLRLFALALLVAVGFQMMFSVISPSSRDKEFSSKCDEHSLFESKGICGITSRNQHLWKMLTLAGGLAVSGLSFFGAYTLDEMDDSGITLSAASNRITSTIPLASWVQLVPAKKHGCQIAANKSVAGTDNKYQRCDYDFLARAVIKESDSCSDVKLKVKYKNRTASVKSMTLRNYREIYEYKGFNDIRVCEYRIRDTDNASRVTFPGKQDSTSLVWNRELGPERIAFYGDTGCRGRNGGDNTKKCVSGDWGYMHDKEVWPVVGVNDSIQSSSPQLIIHLGDYMYMAADNWVTWNYSFFEPTAKLLNKAPWIMVRGNHEYCGPRADAPLGYYLFFDVSGKKLNCDAEKVAYVGKSKETDGEKEQRKKQEVLAMLTDSYALDISENNRIVVIDSAAAFDLNKGKKIKDKLHLEKAYRDIFEQVKVFADIKKEVWMVTHVPTFALELNEDKFEEQKAMFEWATEEGQDPAVLTAARSQLGCLPATVRSVSASKTIKDLKDEDNECVTEPASSSMMRKVWEDIVVKSPNITVTKMIGADRHLSQVVQKKDYPQQITTGAGGVNLDPAPVSNNVSCQPDSAVLSGVAVTLDDATIDNWQHCSHRSFGYGMIKNDEVSGYKFSFVTVTP